MPVQRFKSFEEARRALWVDRDDSRLAERIRRLWAFAAALAPPCMPRGVRKYRSIDEANADREEWTRQRVQELRARRSIAVRTETRAGAS